MTVRELEALLSDMILDMHDENAKVVVIHSGDMSSNYNPVISAQREHEFSRLVQEECKTKDGETFTHVTPEYTNRVVLVI